MLSRDSFKKHIDDIIRHNKMWDDIYEATGGGICATNLDGLESNVVALLESIMEDDGEWISYWAYELCFGKGYKPGCVTDNGVDVPLKTADDLYDFLVANKESLAEVEQREQDWSDNTANGQLLIESLRQALAYKHGDKSVARAVKRTAE